MVRRVCVALAMGTLALVPALVSGRIVHADSSWVATTTQGTPLVTNTHCASDKTIACTPATSLGTLAGTTPLNITVALRVQNPAALQATIRQLNTPGDPQFGKYLTPAQFTQQFAPSADQVNSVVSYLAGKGFTNIQTSPNNLLVTADGTAAAAQLAFNTQLNQYVQDNKVVFANSTPAEVPASVSGIVLSVLGLNNTAVMHTMLHAHQTVPNVPTTYDAAAFQKVYDAGGTHNGQLTTTAIFAEGDLTGIVPRNPSDTSTNDLTLYEDKNNLPHEPVDVIQVGIASHDTAGNTEWDMDTQTSTGIAGGVKHLYVYDTFSLSDPSITAELNQFVVDNKAKAGSASFGGCEYQSYLDGGLQADDTVLQEAAVQGQTVFASSGDTGGTCSIGIPNGVPAGAPFVNYPAASPWVVAVGGTTLLANPDGTYGSETPWTGGGGGPSYFEYQPYWQVGVTPPIQQNCTVQVVSCYGKGLPDIAMDADFLLSAAAFYSGGAPTTNGGTSLASPLSLGVWARLESTNANGFGFASPLFYATYNKTPAPGNAMPAFHDIVAGSNGTYPATPGWDYTTGLGSFDIAQANSVIQKIANPPAPITPTFKAPVCTLASDPSLNDVTPLGSSGPNNALDIQALGLTTANDASNVPNIVGKLMVGSLSDGPGGTPNISGAGDIWDVQWNYTPSGATSPSTYYLEARYTAGVPGNPTPTTTFFYGQVVPNPANGGTLHQPMGTASGNLDTTTNIITIQTPLANVGNPAIGDLLRSPVGEDRESAGAVGFVGDSIGGADYIVGHQCAGSGPTLARVSRASVQRGHHALVFHWSMTGAQSVLGFNLYAGHQRLNSTVIPVRASGQYTVTLHRTAVGPYTLHVLLRGGGQTVVTIR